MLLMLPRWGRTASGAWLQLLILQKVQPALPLVQQGEKLAQGLGVTGGTSKAAIAEGPLFVFLAFDKASATRDDVCSSGCS